jgi:hypothetical protein
MAVIISKLNAPSEKKSEFIDHLKGKLDYNNIPEDMKKKAI